MAIPARNRKRVYAIPRRAPDGSAFQPCDKCGVSVAIALADMHDCGNDDAKRGVKRFRGCFSNADLVAANGTLASQPLSPFRYFMENFADSCDHNDPIDVDRRGFETWKTMSNEERQPYVSHAERVNSAYYRRWNHEIHHQINVSKVNEEANSVKVAKFDTDYCYEYDDCGSFYSSETFGGFESLSSWERDIARMSAEKFL